MLVLSEWVRGSLKRSECQEREPSENTEEHSRQLEEQAPNICTPSPGFHNYTFLSPGTFPALLRVRSGSPATCPHVVLHYGTPDSH